MTKNNHLYFGPSGIHGEGLFAAKSIKKDKYIGTYEGDNTNEDGMHVLWVYEDDGTIVGRNGTSILRYMNHSEEPNAELDGFDCYALRHIKKDEEILIDYNDGEDQDDAEFLE